MVFKLGNEGENHVAEIMETNLIRKNFIVCSRGDFPLPDLWPAMFDDQKVPDGFRRILIRLEDRDYDKKGFVWWIFPLIGSPTIQLSDGTQSTVSKSQPN